MHFILMLLVVITGVVTMHAQSGSEPVWTDDQWQQAKEGIEYKEYPTEKKKTVKDEMKQQEEDDVVEFETEESQSSSWSLDGVFSSSMAKFIGIMLLLVILIVIVYLFMQSKVGNKDSKVPLAAESMPDVLEDLPQETDLERFLRLSLEAGDYKTAIRILYIMIIQRMHEHNWIIWKKDKTNRDYLNEVRPRPSYSQFRDITLVYEIIWYGDNEISGTEFNKLKSLFDSYKGEIRNSTHAQ